MNQIGIELPCPQRERWRHRAGKQFPHAAHPRDRHSPILMLRAISGIRDHHLKLDLVGQALADFLENRLHPADVRVVEFSQLKDLHAAASRVWEAFAFAIAPERTPLNFSASSVESRLR